MPGATLSFLKSDGRFPPNEQDHPIYIRITHVDDHHEDAFDPWFGLPTGGKRTEEERNDRQILKQVQAKVKEGYKTHYFSKEFRPVSDILSNYIIFL